MGAWGLVSLEILVRTHLEKKLDLRGQQLDPMDPLLLEGGTYLCEIKLPNSGVP